MATTIATNGSIFDGDDQAAVKLSALDTDRGYQRLYNALGHFNVALSILGIAGNVVSSIVLRRHGLHRTSNILLWSLAVSDAVFLSGEISSSGRVYHLGGYSGWSGPYARALFMYIVWVCHSMCYLIGHFCSMTIPALITTERLIATLLPFKFASIVTPKRTWAAVGVLVTLSLFFSIVSQYTANTFYYGFIAEYNRTLGVKNIIDYSQELIDLRYYSGASFAIIKGILPLSYVTLGCIVIGTKIRLAARKRQELTSKTADASKERHTTLMLIMVCVLYIITSGLHSILRFVPHDNLQNIKYFLVLECTFLTINSSCNFIIYVVFNKTLREIYKSVILCRKNVPK